ncbi:hypothetical protein O1L60_44820 [Streptomyces diastatochromogenes]|nr:hypothetical protein [Streptomyces diastatochromogenes]
MSAEEPMAAGADLARIALRQAKESARRRGRRPPSRSAPPSGARGAMVATR